jgi:hypothetical protein
MNDLVRAYFERDLSETEKDSLGELLRNSPEASQEFAALAEKKYAATGLPEPRWPHPSGWAVPASLKVAGIAVIAAAVALLTYKGPDLVGPGAGAPDPVDMSSLPEDGTKAPAAGPSVARVTPESFVEGRRYTGLLVVVDKAMAAPARVRVTDPSGREVRVLYDGTLPKGTWVFRWDGRREDGTPMKAGPYSIEVLSTGRTLRQPVQVGPQ